MKKSSIVLITVAIETMVLWFVSHFLGWVFIDTIFLGGLAIFGSVWLFQLYSNKTTNEFNATTRGWTRQDSGGIKPFQFNMSPITLGFFIFLMGSFFIMILTYYPYFLN